MYVSDDDDDDAVVARENDRAGGTRLDIELFKRKSCEKSHS